MNSKHSDKQIINIEYERKNSHKFKIEMNNIGSTEKENFEDFYVNDINYENHTNITSSVTEKERGSNKKEKPKRGGSTKIKFEIDIGH
jgi:hypothetical protein